MRREAQPLCVLGCCGAWRRVTRGFLHRHRERQGWLGSWLSELAQQCGLALQLRQAISLHCSISGCELRLIPHPDYSVQLLRIRSVDTRIHIRASQTSLRLRKYYSLRVEVLYPGFGAKIR